MANMYDDDGADDTSLEADSDTDLTEDSIVDPAVELHALDYSSRLWIEFARTNLAMLIKPLYEYNVLDSRNHKIFTVIPIINEDEFAVGDDKPTTFTLLTLKDAEVALISYKQGSTCCVSSLRIEVFLGTDNFLGYIQQFADAMSAYDAAETPQFRIDKVPKKGGCFTVAKQQFTSDVFIPSYGPGAAGTIGRNGDTMESTVIGEPSGFYFMPVTAELKIAAATKLFILATLITFNTLYN